MIQLNKYYLEDHAPVIPDGKTVEPTDDIQIWIKCAGRKDLYTTLADVLADSECLAALMANDNAVDYLVRSTTWTTMCANVNAMTQIGLNNYCANTLLADETWKNAICTSAYFESVLNVKAPKMTSATTPSGNVFCSSQRDGAYGRDAWHAFDGVGSSSMWQASTSIGTSCYIGYTFSVPAKCYCAKLLTMNNVATNGVFQGSNGTFINLCSAFSVSGNTTHLILFNQNIDSYSSYRLYISSQSGSVSYGGQVATLQFYGRKDV